MKVNTTRLGLARDLCRLLKTAMGHWPTMLVWSGHDAAWRAMVGPHQRDTLDIRVSLAPYDADFGVVLLKHLPNTPSTTDGLWAYWGVTFRRLDTYPDMAIANLAQHLIADPTPPRPQPAALPAPEQLLIPWTHARCLLCDRAMGAGAHRRHLTLIHDINLADLHHVGQGGGVYEFNDASGRAVLWLWTEHEETVPS